jgi:sulfur-carrier protein
MKILAFGMIAEYVGSDAIEIDLPKDLNTLRLELLKKYPELHHKQFMIAVNRQKTDHNISLTQADEVALIPPFAGG